MSQRGSGVGGAEPGRPRGGTVAGRGAAAAEGLRAPGPARVAHGADQRRAQLSRTQPEPPFVCGARGREDRGSEGRDRDGTEGPGAAATSAEPIWERGSS